MKSKNIKSRIDRLLMSLERRQLEEFIKLYVECVENHFRRASDRSSYQHGASMLKTLIGYGARREAYEIIELQKVRRPRRPALIDELSKVK